MADPTKAQYALRFIAGKYKGGEFPLKPNRDVIVGRNSEYDMVLHEDMVSRRHAKISTHNGQIILSDMQSTNGSFVNGEKVTVARLKVGDRVLIGTSMMQLVEIDSSSTSLAMQDTPTGPLESGATTRVTHVAASKGTVNLQPQAVSEITATTTQHTAINPAEIATISESASAKTRPPADALPPDRTESMRGRFPDDDMEVPDLVEFFNGNRKSGILVLTTERDGDGHIYFRDGHLYFAAIFNLDDTGELTRAEIPPVKAFYRMVRWLKGDFRFYTTATLPAFDNEIQDESRNLLLEGVRQWDEMRKFLKHVPPPGNKLNLNIPLRPRMSDLSAEALDTLQIVINCGEVGRVLDDSEASDFETYQDLLYLLQNGYISVA